MTLHTSIQHKKVSNKASCSSYFDTVLNGDALMTLASLPNNLVDMIVTSPPYFGQRDYGTSSQIGNEVEPKLYLSRLLEVFDEAHRVLKPSGTFWLNLGDKYLDGELCGIPWRVALSLKDRGWILKSDVIWHKSNAMPSSVKSRPTVDHEYLFFFSKNSTYYYDADAIREPHITFSKKSRMKGGRNHFGKINGTPEKGKNSGNSNLHNARWDQAFHKLGRNKRTVWEVPLSKFRDAHFAVFPEKLIEPCILSSCPENGLVLDPFFGAGTTGVVAKKKRRHYLGIEINPDYCAIALKRLKNIQGELL